MKAPRNVNDGSKNPPRLAIYGNTWGLMELPKLPRMREWSFEEKLDKLVEAGFDGVQAGPTESDQIRSRGLRYCSSSRINTPVDAESAVKDAAHAGADCMTVHAGWGMESDAEIDAIVGAILDASVKNRCPVYIETHRATLAQDIYRIVELTKRIPDVRFNGDFSHLYCGQEMGYRGFATTRHYLTPILQRTSFFHGRISDGQCMQSDVGNGRENIHAKNFQSLWEEAMGYWLKDARPGDILPFAPELGPPSSGYSITHKDASGQTIELSDRWQQSLVLKRLAEEAFTAAKAG